MKLLALALLLVALLAHADAEQVIGTNPCRSLGLELVQFSVGEHVIASVCMSTAELERATYQRGPDEGRVACRVMYVRGK